MKFTYLPKNQTIIYFMLLINATSRNRVTNGNTRYRVTYIEYIQNRRPHVLNLTSKIREFSTHDQ